MLLMIRAALAATLLAVAGAGWLAPPAAAQAVPGLPHWRWQNPLPTGYYLTDIAPFSDSSALVVGGHGTALVTTNRGRTWQPLNTGTTRDIIGVSFADRQTGWLMYNTPLTNPATQAYNAGPGEVRRTTDGGRTWTRQPIGENRSVLMLNIQALSPTEAYVLYSYTYRNNNGTASPITQMRHTINGGQTWQLVTPPLYNHFVNFYGRNTMHFVSSTTGYLTGFEAGSSGHGLFKTTDGAQTWRRFGPDTTTRADVYFWFLNARHAWVTADTTLYETTNGGQTWVAHYVRPSSARGRATYITAFSFADSLHGVATENQGRIYTTADGGQTWQDGAPLDEGRGNLRTLRAVGTAVWAAGEQGDLAYSADRGQTWARRTRRTVALGRELAHLEAPDPTHAWTSALYDTVLWRRTGYAGTWQPVSLRAVPLNWAMTTPFVWDARFPDRDTGFVAMLDGTLLTPTRLSVSCTTDAGLTWTPVFLPVPNQFLYSFTLAFHNPRRGVLVGDKGLIFVTHDAGQSWQPVLSGSTQTLRTVSWADAQTVYVGGDSTTLLKSADAGLTWQSITTLPQSADYYAIKLLSFRSAQVGIAEYSHTTDGGQTWSAGTGLTPYPALPPQANGGGNDIKNLLFCRPRHVWALGRNSFRSSDAGRTWPLVAQTELDVLGGAAIDDYNAWVVGRNGQIIRYSEKYIQTDTVATQRLAYCTGDTATIAFDTTGIFGPTERNFRIELSNKMGRFRPNQTTILPLLGAASASPLRAVLPATLAAGTRYRLRVIRADSSVLGGDNERDLTIYPRPAAVAVAPADSARFCQGDSVLLTAPAGFGQYQWSTGATPAATTAGVWVRAAGVYTVRVAAGGGCFGPASRPVTVRVTPRPATPTLTPTQPGSGPVLLTAVPALPGATYIWTGPGGVVAGASGPALLLTAAAQDGFYSVTVTARGCVSPASASVLVRITGLGEEADRAGLTLSPNPATTAVTLRSAAGVREATVLDAVGRVVRRRTVAGSQAADPELIVPLAGLPAGLYQVQATLGDGRTAHRRLLIER